jgi:hypothetical protein
MSPSSPEPMESASPDPTSIPEEFVEPTTTETAYSKFVAEASDTVKTATDNDPACASAAASASNTEEPLAALASPLVKHRRRGYGSAAAAAPTDSLAATATDTDAIASTTITKASTTTPMEEESDGEQSGLRYDSEDEKVSSIVGQEEDMSEDDDDDDDKSVTNTKEKPTSFNEEEANVMEEEEDKDETGDAGDSMETSKEHVAPEISNDSEDDEHDDALETQPAPEASSAGRTKKTRQELSEASASKKVAETETTSTAESPTPAVTTDTTETAVTTDQDKENAPAPNTLPDEDAIIASTDNLYMQVDDKESVTLKDFFSSLTAEYGCKLDKPTKALVRQRLTDLISGDAQPSVDNDNVSDVGDAESESEEEEEEEEGKEEQQSDYDDGSGDDEASVGKKKKAKSTPKKRRKAASTTKKPRKPSSGRKTKASSETLAVRVHADKLRKRRMEELRVRNEELQLHQSEEDQKRSELIAAKFETNTDELRVQRLEQRLDLLQKLDQRRTTVMQHGRPVVKQEPVDAKEKEVKTVVTEPVKEAPVEEPAATSEESDSDDDMELEFVGEGSAKFAPFSLQHTKPNHALSVLDMADRVGGKAKQPKKQASPGRSMNARASLRNQLLAKQRKMGNKWLARELGYKNEEEHLRDCMQVENKKMEMSMKKEEVRLQANERKQLRLRLMTQSEYNEPEENDDGEEEFVPKQDDEQDSASIDGDEEDEEMQMAKAIEKEQANDAGEDPSAAADEESPTNTEDEPGAKDEDEGPEKSEEAEDDDQLETQAPFVSFPNTESSEAREVAPSLDDKPTRISMSPIAVDANKAVSNGVHTTNTGTDEAVGSNDLEDSDDDAEFEMTDEPEPSSQEVPAEDKPKGPRNSAWRAMLQKDAEHAKKMKKQKNGLVEEEADEEEEEEVAGLEDFGFSVHKKKADDDEDGDDELDEDDLEHVVDDVSDNEGDEEEGEKARQEMARKEEKERHQEMIRRMRDGYDGRRGGIAGGGAGARGIHRFDQLVAADNREDAKRLGLLNDDEDDSDQEGGDKADADDEDDEALLLDKMLKDRFLHRSSVEDEENFSDDEAEQENEGEEGEGGGDGAEDNIEDKEQDLLAKRFAKRARMQRLIDAHGQDEEFSQAKLIDDDAAMKLELQKMKVRQTRRSQIQIANSFD